MYHLLVPNAAVFTEGRPGGGRFPSPSSGLAVPPAAANGEEAPEPRANSTYPPGILTLPSRGTDHI